ncbi:hypothetical protein VTO42DRAFT_1697 [Malbranchea cinnamomea]
MRSIRVHSLVSLLFSFSIAVDGAPLHQVGHSWLSNLPGVLPHVGLRADAVEYKQSSLQPIVFGDGDVAVEQSISPSRTSYRPEPETRLPTTELMQIGIGSERPDSAAEPVTSVYSYGAFYPLPETWPTPRPAATNPPVDRRETEEEATFIVADSARRPLGPLDMLLALDTEGLAIWAAVSPVWAWMFIFTLLLLLLVVSIVIVETVGAIQRSHLNWRSLLCGCRSQRVQLTGPERSLSAEKRPDDGQVVIDVDVGTSRQAI